MRGMFSSFICVTILSCVVASNAQTKFPLRVNIDVKAKTKTRLIGEGDSGKAEVERVQVEVKVRKSSGKPYEDMLGAELYIIGKQIHTGYYGIIDVVKKDFHLTKDNDNSFSFKTKPYDIGRTSGSIEVGGTYETYLFVLADKNGEILETRSGRVIREKGIDFIRELDQATLFDRDGNVIGKVENPGADFKKAVPIVLREEDAAGRRPRRR